MSSLSPRRWLLLLSCSLWCGSVEAQQPAVPANSQAPVPVATPAVAVASAPVAQPAASLAVRFYSQRTVLWLARTAVVPFQLTQPASSDLTLPVSTTDFGVVEICRPPEILAGHTTGFLRVRGLLPGHTRLLLPGGAGIDLDVKPDPAAAVADRVNPESGKPRIVSPSANAAVWGEFAVGVDVFDRFARAGTADRPGSTSGTRVQLRLPDGRLLDPVVQTGPDIGPELHCQFNVQAGDFPSGPLRLVAIASPAGFTDLDRRSARPGLVLESDPLVCSVQSVRANGYWSGECEAPEIMGATKNLFAPAHSVVQGVFGIEVPEVAADAAASGGRMVACYGEQAAWSLPFHVQNPGMYQLFVRARGDFACGAWPSLALYLGSTEVAAGTVRLSSNRYERVPVGDPVALEGGPRMFTVAFRNDFGHGKEDRNAYLDRWEVARVGDLPPDPPKEKANAPHPPAPAPQTAPVAAVPMIGGPSGPGGLPRAADFPPMTPLAPAVELLYPANGAGVYGLDAAVARLGEGAARASWVDLVIDGQPQGERIQGPVLADGGPLVFPLLTRTLAPGSHRIAVRVANAGGQSSDSAVREIGVLPQAPAAPGPFARAVFLLDRLAFGPEPRELAAVLTQGEAAWLNAKLTSGFDAPSEQALWQAGSKQFPQLGSDTQTINRALYQWLGSDNPVRTRFTAWAENHFSTWINKTEADWKWREHVAFCRLGIAPFADLLSASAHSPAMLKYLDQERSYAGKLNENYAREIMELHTLGVHGGYHQEDVTALAGVLNGWTTAREVTLPQDDDAQGLAQTGGNRGALESTFVFDPLLNDGKARDVFGLRFPATKDADERHDHIETALEMLASHPSTAEHVCRKLAEHYVGVPAPDGLVQVLARTFLASGGDMRMVLRAMVSQPDFWRASPRLATPFDFGLRITRLCQSTMTAAETTRDLVFRPGQVEGFLKKSGMGLFDRVTPDGYPEDGANYADSNALLQRWRFVQALGEPLNRLVPAAWRTSSAVAPSRAANDPSAPPASAGARSPEAAQRFIDLASARLTGHLLAPESNQSALEVLGQGTPEQLRATVVFIALLPETSLR